jgi:kynurenine formamidase
VNLDPVNSAHVAPRHSPCGIEQQGSCAWQRHITSWTGVELQGRPAPPTPENVAAVMELYPVGERFFQEVTGERPHFHSTMNRGERAITIDEVPLEWCFNPGVKLDFRHFADGYVATAADVEAELRRIGHRLEPLDIVVVNTAAGTSYGQPDYVAKGCGMGREATLYLLERGVRVTGTDGWSWDAPFIHTMKRYAETRDAGLIWEGHKAGREIGYCHIEKLHNLEALPATGFTVSCFPVKVRGGSAGWTRAVAIID